VIAAILTPSFLPSHPPLGLLPAFNADTSEEDIQKWARANLSLVILLCFCMAFFVAAMVEELFK